MRVSPTPLMFPPLLPPSPRRCRSCDAPIYWAQTVSSGKAMPVDAEPVPDGNVVLLDCGGTVIARVLGRGETPPPGAVLRRAHHSTCPQADPWRRGRRRSAA